MTKQSSRRLVNALVYPVAMYGWVINNEKERKEEDRKFGNVVLETNVEIPIDCKENKQISAWMSSTTTDIHSTDHKTETVMLWTHHAENGSLKKSTMRGVIEGGRGRGRPCMHWMDGVKAATKPSLYQSSRKQCRMGMFGEICSGMSPEVGHDLTEWYNYCYNLKITLPYCYNIWCYY